MKQILLLSDHVSTDQQLSYINIDCTLKENSNNCFDRSSISDL